MVRSGLLLVRGVGGPTRTLPEVPWTKRPVRASRLYTLRGDIDAFASASSLDPWWKGPSAVWTSEEIRGTDRFNYYYPLAGKGSEEVELGALQAQDGEVLKRVGEVYAGTEKGTLGWFMGRKGMVQNG